MPNHLLGRCDVWRIKWKVWPAAGAMRKLMGSSDLQGFIIRTPWVCAVNHTATGVMVVEIFREKQRGWKQIQPHTATDALMHSSFLFMARCWGGCEAEVDFTLQTSAPLQMPGPRCQRPATPLYICNQGSRCSSIASNYRAAIHPPDRRRTSLCSISCVLSLTQFYLIWISAIIMFRPPTKQGK